DNRTCSRNKKDSRINADGADRRNEGVAFDDDLCTGNERLQKISVKTDALRASGPGKSTTNDVRLLCELRDTGGNGVFRCLGAYGEIVGRAGMDVADFVVVLVNEEKGGLRPSAVDAEIAHLPCPACGSPGFT